MNRLSKEEKYYMDEYGCAQIEEEMAQAYKEMNEAYRLSKDIPYNMEGNPEINPINEVLINKADEIRRLEHKLANKILINKKSDESLIDCDDIVKIDFTISNGDSTEMDVKLVGGRCDVDSVPVEISLNCPLGKNLYGKTVGSEFSYQVEGTTYTVFIKDKFKVENIKSISK